MDEAYYQNAYAQQQNPKKKEEQMKKQQEMEEKRKVMLQSLLTNEARERCNNLFIIKYFSK